MAACNMTSVTYKSRVVYTCREGLSLVGDRERTCEANGMWSGEPPTCHSELDIQAQQIAIHRALFHAKFHGKQSLLYDDLN